MRHHTLIIAAFLAVLGGNIAVAQQPDSVLVVQEVAISKAISEAEVAKSAAEYHLANWRLQQLKSLRFRGHATWQEVAEQEKQVSSLKSGFDAAKGHLAFTVDVEAKVTHAVTSHVDNEQHNSPLTDSESIRLFMPGATRLVGWLPAKQANTDLLTRQLENLKVEFADLAQIDPAELSAKAAAATQLVTKLENAGNPDRIHVLNRAKVQAQLASANEQLAVAHKSYAKVLARRIAVLESIVLKRADLIKHDSLAKTDDVASLAVFGSPLVDSTNTAALQSLTHDIAKLEANAHKPIELLQQLEASQLDRVSRLETLSQYKAANPNELTQAKSQLSDIQAAIQQQKKIQEQQQQLVSQYPADADLNETINGANRESVASELTAFVLRDATAVRHLLELDRKRASMVAASHSAAADLAYHRQRLGKLETIDPQALSPLEIEHAQAKIQLAAGRQKMIASSMTLLDHESSRFVAQQEAQRQGNFQLVQVEAGKFLQRSELAEQEALVAAFGFVGPGKSIYSGSLGYLESPAILSYLTALCPNLQPQVSATQTANMMANREFGFSTYRPGTRSSIWKTRPATRGLRLATDGIAYPSDLFNFVPSGLWQVYPGYRYYGSNSYRPFAYGYHAGHSLYSGKSYSSRKSYYAQKNFASKASSFQSRIPRYSDYYAFGIRRYDGPAGSKFKRGVRAYSPFFIPGSPTNFRY